MSHNRYPHRPQPSETHARPREREESYAELHAVLTAIILAQQLTVAEAPLGDLLRSSGSIADDILNQSLNLYPR